MARGKYLSLEEARRMGRLDQFCKEHSSTGDREKFDRLFEAMDHRGLLYVTDKAKGFDVLEFTG